MEEKIIVPIVFASVTIGFLFGFFLGMVVGNHNRINPKDIKAITANYNEEKYNEALREQQRTKRKKNSKKPDLYIVK